MTFLSVHTVRIHVLNKVQLIWCHKLCLPISVSCSAPPELVQPVQDEHRLYYTENLNISCECKGIPAPDVNWVTINQDFAKQNSVGLPNSGTCLGIYHSDQYISWSTDVSEESKKDANGLELKCECSHSGGNLVDRATVLNVQCKYASASFVDRLLSLCQNVPAVADQSTFSQHTDTMLYVVCGTFLSQLAFSSSMILL